MRAPMDICVTVTLLLLHALKLDLVRWIGIVPLGMGECISDLRGDKTAISFVGDYGLQRGAVEQPRPLPAPRDSSCRSSNRLHGKFGGRTEGSRSWRIGQ